MTPLLQKDEEEVPFHQKCRGSGFGFAMSASNNVCMATKINMLRIGIQHPEHGRWSRIQYLRGEGIGARVRHLPIAAKGGIFAFL